MSSKKSRHFVELVSQLFGFLKKQGFQVAQQTSSSPNIVVFLGKEISLTFSYDAQHDGGEHFGDEVVQGKALGLRDRLISYCGDEMRANRLITFVLSVLICAASVGYGAASSDPFVDLTLKEGEIQTIPFSYPETSVVLEAITSNQEVTVLCISSAESRRITLDSDETIVEIFPNGPSVKLRGIDVSSNTVKVSVFLNLKDEGGFHSFRKIHLRMGAVEDIDGIKVVVKKVVGSVAEITASGGVYSSQVTTVNAKAGGYIFKKAFGARGLQVSSLDSDHVILMHIR